MTATDALAFAVFFRFVHNFLAFIVCPQLACCSFVHAGGAETRATWRAGCVCICVNDGGIVLSGVNRYALTLKRRSKQ